MWQTAKFSDLQISEGHLVVGGPNGNTAEIALSTIVETRTNENFSVLMNTSAAIYADGEMGKADPTGQLSGWYFKNSDDVTNKINWYTIGGNNPSHPVKYGSLENVYAVIDVVGGTQLPFFTIYSQPSGSNNNQQTLNAFDIVSGGGYTATAPFLAELRQIGSLLVLDLTASSNAYIYNTADNLQAPFPSGSYIKIGNLYYKIETGSSEPLGWFSSRWVEEVRDENGNIVENPTLGTIGNISVGDHEIYELGDGTNINQPATNWYTSRKVLSNTTVDLTPYIGQRVLIHYGPVTGVHPTLPRIELSLDLFSSVGPMDDLENIMFGALSTSTGYAAGSYEFSASAIGFKNLTSRTEYILSTFNAGSDAPPPTLEYSNTHHITLDSTNDYIDLTGTGDVLDFSGTKSWSVGIECVDVSSISDNAWMVLFRSGDNVVTLRRGGSNWGIYCYANGNAVCQANTWYAPSAGSKILVQYNHTTNKLEYWLDGFRRANMSLNANTASNANVAGEFQVGKGGGPSLSGYFYPNYWYGGVNNLMLGGEFLATDAVARYFSTEDISSIEEDYPDVIDFCTLGEQTYPTVTGLKGAVTGELKNGTEEDFKENS